MSELYCIECGDGAYQEVSKKEIEFLRAELDRARKERDTFRDDAIELHTDRTNLIADLDIEKGKLAEAEKERDSWKIQCEIAQGQAQIASLTDQLREAREDLAVAENQADTAIDCAEQHKSRLAELEKVNQCDCVKTVLDLEQKLSAAQLREARDEAKNRAADATHWGKLLVEVREERDAAQRALSLWDSQFGDMICGIYNEKGDRISGGNMRARDIIKANLPESLRPAESASTKSTEPDSTHGAKCKVPELAESDERGKCPEIHQPYLYCSKCGPDSPSLPEGRAGKP